MPDLEERVAALEARMAPMHLTFSSSGPAWEPLTEAEEAELREAIAEVANLPPRVVQPPPLTADEIRQLLSECVTVVKPGETLILRVPWTTTPTQVRELQVVLDETTAWLELPFKALVVPGDELTVAQAPEPDFMARVTTEPLGGPEHLRGALTIRLTHEPTGVTVAARDRTEGVHKLRKALADRTRRQYDLQEAERRRQRKAEEAPGA